MSLFSQAVASISNLLFFIIVWTWSDDHSCCVVHGYLIYAESRCTWADSLRTDSYIFHLIFQYEYCTFYLIEETWCESIYAFLSVFNMISIIGHASQSDSPPRNNNLLHNYLSWISGGLPPWERVHLCPDLDGAQWTLIIKSLWSDGSFLININ